MSNYSDFFRGRKILITGGLGFIGSNLAIKLVELDADVTLADSMLPLYGGNLFNIQPIKDKVHISFSDVRDKSSMNYLVQDKDYIFHLAGQVSHVDSIINPFMDVEINVMGTLSVLEACKRNNPEARLIFTGTRGQYGPSVKLPVDENAPTNPMGMYAITNLTAEKMILMYHNIHRIRGVCLRITNTYGPRHQMKHNRYGVLNWFIRLVLDNETIPVFGDGQILRDFLCIDDLVECLLMVATCEEAYGEIFNVGSGTGMNFLDLAKTIIKVARSGRYEFTEFSPERKAVEPGDYYADISKIRRLVGWEPKTAIEVGLKKTIEYYKQYRYHYWKKGEKFKINEK